eukprot:767473-Hanusia_phi.AAC.1
MEAGPEGIKHGCLESSEKKEGERIRRRGREKEAGEGDEGGEGKEKQDDKVGRDGKEPGEEKGKE